MYSLYRAWLSLGPCGPLSTSLPTFPPLNLTSNGPGAPDVTLQVGPGLTHFSAHKNILITHSGYFKAALTNHTGNVPIAVPNVNVDEFSSLLTFMYTGYLDLNLTNIYNILLATHILHMPQALELCRSFLIQNQNLDARPNIIKPIPSRKSAVPHQQIYAPLFSHLQKSEVTPFRPIEKPPDEPKPETPPKETKPKPARKREEKPTVSTAEKTIVDIACCDGPVRFHRVVNDNYGNTSNVENDYVEINRNEAMNKIMNENIREQMRDENQQGGGEHFRCVYCNHTFKSQYCYQKHARRHLNPVNLEAKNAQAKIETVKREVKLLDMNVQYYPCKTCGSKFPSYYFVHKHRKMCHANEMTEGNKSEETKSSSEEVEVDVSQ